MRASQSMTAKTLSATVKKLSMAVVLLPVLHSQNSFAVSCEGEDCACQPHIIAFPNNTVDGPAGKIPVVLEADNVESSGDDEVILSGDAFVAQGRQSIAAEKITYSKATDYVSGEGNVTLRSVAGDLITAEAIELDVNTKIGSARNAQFKLAERGEIAEDTNAVIVQSRGSAGELSIEGEQFTRLKNVNYTTCAEGQDDFFIRATELELDQATGMGVAKGASIVFKGVPIFYAPRFTFPITDERKSGFLFPSVGTDSDSGFTFSVPWYWNIAPNTDATFFPRLYTDRGFQLGAEVRNLTQNSETYFYAEVLPSDDVFDNETRSVVTLQHDHDLTDNLTATVDYNDVSDQDYFTDFRNDINAFSTTFIPRNARLNYRANYWNASASVSEFELVDDSINPENEPFERKPEITFDSNFPQLGLFEFETSASATNFSHDTRDGGWRYLVKPSVAVPLERVWGYLTPRLELDYAAYSVDQEDVDSRSVPVFSIDSGVYLEKRVSFLGETSVQTLEPRVYFVYAGEDNQDNAPIFDTRALTFNNFNNLFSASGFSGGDRAADNRQVTLALTSRIFDSTGKQRLKGSIGQAFYLEDREVTISGETQTASKSDFLAEVDVDFGNHWEVGSFLQYSTETSDIQTVNLTTEYRENSNKFFSFGYRRSDISTTPIEQIIVDTEWPLNQSWSVFGTERYSIEDSEELQTQLGVEYDACCWRLRVAANRLRTTDGDSRNSIIAEFELTGLGKVKSGLGL